MLFGFFDFFLNKIKVEIVDPPAGTKIGERVMVEGFDLPADESIDLKKKSNPWTPVQKELATSADRVATYKVFKWF